MAEDKISPVTSLCILNLYQTSRTARLFTPQWWLLVSLIRSWFRTSAKGKIPKASFYLIPERIIPTWAHNNRDGWGQAFNVTRQTAPLWQNRSIILFRNSVSVLVQFSPYRPLIISKNYYSFKLNPVCCSHCCSLRPNSVYVNAFHLPVMTTYSGSIGVPPHILKPDTRWRCGHLHVPAVLSPVPIE